MIAALLFMAIIIFTMPSCIKDNFKFNKIAQIRWKPEYCCAAGIFFTYYSGY